MAQTSYGYRFEQPTIKPLNEGPSFLAVARPAVLLLAVPVAIFAAVVVYAMRQHPARPGPPPGTRGALVWANGEVTFATRAQVAAWLKIHGGRFSSFKLRHPAAVELVTPAPKLAAGSKRKQAPAHTKPASSHRQTVAAAPPTLATTSTGRSLGTIALGVLAAFLFLLGIVPRSPVRRFGRANEGRLVALAASAAIAAGLGVALLT
jgi:hypothetical protein